MKAWKTGATVKRQSLNFESLAGDKRRKSSIWLHRKQSRAASRHGSASQHLAGAPNGWGNPAIWYTEPTEHHTEATEHHTEDTERQVNHGTYGQEKKSLSGAHFRGSWHICVVHIITPPFVRYQLDADSLEGVGCSGAARRGRSPPRQDPT